MESVSGYRLGAVDFLNVLKKGCWWGRPRRGRWRIELLRNHNPEKAKDAAVTGVVYCLYVLKRGAQASNACISFWQNFKPVHVVQ